MDPWNDHPRAALHAYLDGELSLEGSLAVEQHLTACELCRREQETLGALQRTLRSDKGRAPEPEPALVPPRGALRVSRRTFVLGAAVAIAATLVTVLLGPQRGTRIMSDVTQVHARAVKDGRPVDLASDDPAVIEGWLAARLPESVPLARGGEGFALRGARVDSIDGRLVATVVYQVRSHLAGVSAWRSSEPDSEPQPTVAGAWTICRWAHGGVAYWMASSAGVDDLRALAALIRDRPT